MTARQVIAKQSPILRPTAQDRAVFIGTEGR